MATEGEEINIKIKLSSDKNESFKINTSWTVLKLKETIQEQTGSEPSQMKLIFKGRILKDADPVSNYKVTEGSIMHLVVSKPADQKSETTQSQSTEQSQPQQQQQSQPQQQQQQQQDPLAGLMGGMGGMGAMGGLGGNIDPNQIGAMLNNPMMQQMMNNLAQDPQMMQQLVNSNPALQQMAQSNPQMQAMLNNPALMQQTLQMLGGGGLGGLGGAQQPAGQQQQQPQQQGTGSQGGAQPDLMSLLQGNPMLAGLDLNALGLGGQGLGGQGNVGAQDNTPPEEKYKDQLQQLETMGFTNKDLNIQALQATMGNVDAAVERLINMLG